MGLCFIISLILLLLLREEVFCQQNLTIEARLQEMEKEVAHMRQNSEDIRQLRQNLAALKDQLNAPTQQDVPIAFTAKLSKISSLGTQQHVVFDEIVTNTGNAYSGLHGIFTAPRKGVYAFFIVITCFQNNSATVALMRNGEPIGQVLADATYSNVLQTSTLAMTVQLEVADEVWVHHGYAYSSGEVLNGYGWSLFSGHLVGAY